MIRTHCTLPALLAAAALVAAGCGSDSSTKQPTNTKSNRSTSGQSTSGLIKMENIAFNPKSARVQVGQKVTWEDAESVPHDVVATSGASFKSDTFGKGETFSWTPAKPGTVKYECTLHPGMVGTLEVVAKGR